MLFPYSALINVLTDLLIRLKRVFLGHIIPRDVSFNLCVAVVRVGMFCKPPICIAKTNRLRGQSNVS